MNEQSKQFTLLLVDDNPTNLTLLAKIIEIDLPQVRVLTADSGAQGLQLAEREQIDGAFIDVQMPEMSGLEMCRRLKADPRTAAMPLVLITAHLASPEMRAEGLEVGAYDFISQPISNVEMLARIKVMLRLCERERARRGEAGQQLRQNGEPSLPLRWLTGLFLSANGGETDPLQLHQLAAGLSGSEELNDLQLAELWVESFPAAWQQSLLKVALLDQIPPTVAGKLSELGDIEAVFDYLQRHNLLLVAADGSGAFLQFKPEVKNFLRQQSVQRLPAGERQHVFRLAADWYQQQGEPLHAFACLLQGERYPELSQLLNTVGLGLLVAQHQSRLLELLAKVPEEEAVQCGWLALYTGVSCMRSESLEVDTWLELARNRFVAGGDRRGELLTLAQQIMQYLVADGQLELGLNRLLRLRELAVSQLDLLDSCNRLHVQLALAMGELFYAGRLKISAELLAEAMSEALREKQFEMQAYLLLLQALLGIFQGRFRVARSAMEQAGTALARLPESSHPRLIFGVVACELLHACGELDSFSRQRHQVRKVSDAEVFQQSALGPLLNFYSALSDIAQGKWVAAEELLEVALLESPAALRPHLQSWILQLRGFLHAQAGRFAEASSDCQQALDLRERVDIALHRLPNRLLAGATLSLLTDGAAAIEQLRSGLDCSIELQEERYRGGFHAWLAACYIDQNEPAAALDQLDKLFALLRRQGVDFFFGLTPELLQKLAPLAVSRSDWMESLERLAEQYLDCRPDPEGRLVPLAQLQTLGGFKFRLGEHCCDLSEVGQASRQLMALLAVAPNGSMSNEMLMGILWPDSPPSKARSSFDTALSRLRKALETSCGKQIRQDYLLLEKGLLLLRNLKIDSNQLSLLIGGARRQLQRQTFWQAELTFWRIEKLWQGRFLAGFELEGELPYRREELTLLRLEQLSGLAQLLLQRGETEQASRLLQTGLLAEPTHDVLVQQLFNLYQQQGEKRALRQLLESYRTALQSEDYDDEEIDELLAALGPQ